VQFNAGKCNLAPQPDGAFLVTPDRRKGKISLQKGNDSLLHFKWTDRSTNAALMDLIVFPDEVVFKKVVTGTPSDRVYMLKWKIGDRREMFWLQDKRTDNDSDNCEKLNRFIANPDATNPPGESDDLLRMLRSLSLLPLSLSAYVSHLL
jgi:26S proteasome regulatory subunit N13